MIKKLAIIILLLLGVGFNVHAQTDSDRDAVYKVNISAEDKNKVFFDSKCVQCDIVQFVYVVGSRYAYVIYKIVGSSIKGLVLITFAFWLLWYVTTKFILGYQSASSNTLVDLWKKMAWVSISVYALTLNPSSFYNNTMNIILDLGIRYGYLALGENKVSDNLESSKKVMKSASPNFQKYCVKQFSESDSNVEGYAFSMETKRDIMCLMGRIIATYNDNIAFGLMLAKHSISPGIIIPNIDFFMFISGLAVCVIYFMTSVYFVFQFIDVVFRLAIAGIFAPIGIALFTFDKFQNILTDRVVKLFKDGAFTIVFLCVILGLTNQMLVNVARSQFKISLSNGEAYQVTISDFLDKTNKNLYDSESKLNNVAIEVLQKYSQNSANWLLLIVAGAICLAFSSKVKSLVGDWGGSDDLGQNLKQVFDSSVNKVKSMALNLASNMGVIKAAADSPQGENMLRDSVAQDKRDRDMYGPAGAPLGSDGRPISPTGAGREEGYDGYSGAAVDRDEDGTYIPKAEQFKSDIGNHPAFKIPLDEVERRVEGDESSASQSLLKYIERYRDAKNFNEVIENIEKAVIAGAEDKKNHKERLQELQATEEEIKRDLEPLEKAKEAPEFKNLFRALSSDEQERINAILDDTEIDKTIEIENPELRDAVRKVYIEKKAINRAQIKKNERKVKDLQEQILMLKNKVSKVPTPKDLLLAEWQMRLEQAQKKNLRNVIREMKRNIASVEDLPPDDETIKNELRAMAKKKKKNSRIREFLENNKEYGGGEEQ
jgi:hypothetical protein